MDLEPEGGKEGGGGRNKQRNGAMKVICKNFVFANVGSWHAVIIMGKISSQVKSNNLFTQCI